MPPTYRSTQRVSGLLSEYGSVVRQDRHPGRVFYLASIPATNTFPAGATRRYCGLFTISCGHRFCPEFCGLLSGNWRTIWLFSLAPTRPLHFRTGVVFRLSQPQCLIITSWSYFTECRTRARADVISLKLAKLTINRPFGRTHGFSMSIAVSCTHL